MVRFVRVKSKAHSHDIFKTRHQHFFEIGQHRIEVSKEVTKKIKAIDGRQSYKKLYKLVFDQQAIVLDATSQLIGKVVEKLDYQQSNYLRLDVAGRQSILVKVDSKLKDVAELNINLDVKKLEIWHNEVDFRIA